MAISNKTLIILLVTAIVISVGGAVINVSRLTELARYSESLTGQALRVTTGYVNVTVVSQTAINLSVVNISFGSGYVSTGGSARLNTTNQSSGKPYYVWTKTNWSNTSLYDPYPLEIVNVGNNDVTSLIAYSNRSNASMIQGTNPMLLNAVQDKEAGSCAAGAQTTFTDFNATLCTDFNYADATDELYYHIELLIPEDAPAVAKNNTLTFEAS